LARQEAVNVQTFRRHAAADHLGDGAGDHHGRQIGFQRRVSALHGVFGAGAHFVFAEPGDDDGKLMGRQRIGVVEHRGHRQVFTPDRTVDDHLQTLDRGEDIHRAPVSTGSVVIEH